MFSMKEKYNNNNEIKECYAFFALPNGHTSIEDLCEKGLNESLVTNGGYLGDGFYCAQDPTSLILRSQSDAVLLHVRLFMVNYLKVSNPLLKKSQILSSFDSAIDETNGIYCIFDKNQFVLLNIIFTK
jgi:hypothetical protein